MADLKGMARRLEKLEALIANTQDSIKTLCELLQEKEVERATLIENLDYQMDLEEGKCTFTDEDKVYCRTHMCGILDTEQCGKEECPHCAYNQNW